MEKILFNNGCYRDEFFYNLKIINKEKLKFFGDDFANFLSEHLFYDLRILSKYYPDFDFWLTEKVIPGLIFGERSILLEWDNKNIVGIAILKNNIDEKKICCLRVNPQFQNKGIGVRLFKESMLILETETPLLSISDKNPNLNSFLKIFNYFGFCKEAVYPDFYVKNNTEISFNGILTTNS